MIPFPPNSVARLDRKLVAEITALSGTKAPIVNQEASDDPPWLYGRNLLVAWMNLLL